MFEGLISLFRTSPPPAAAELEYDGLGTLNWEPDGGWWRVCPDELEFILTLRGTPRPSEAMVHWARSICKNPAPILQAVKALLISQASMAEIGAQAQEEILRLRIDNLILRSPGSALVSLEGGDAYRCWRCEYRDGTASDLGFDS